MTPKLGSSLWRRPGTRLGWWAVGLAAAFAVLSVVNSAVLMQRSQDVPDTGWIQALLASYSILMMLCGLAAGIGGLIAVIRKHERSWLVWLTLLPGAFVLFFVLGEFLVPH
jgi:hypothetical protein